MPRPRYTSLKRIKRQIAAGDLECAYQALLGKHDALLMTLRHTRSPEERIEVKYRLTLVETKLAVTASLKGEHDAADGWFRRAREHFMAFDPVTHERMDREEAAHLIRKGEVYDALDLFSGAERAFRTILRFRKSSLPETRVELEHAITLSCKAEAELLLNPHSIEARTMLEQAQTTLHTGNKRRYELDNLMRLITFAGLFERRRALYIARATWINETVVHNPVIRLTLLDAACGPFPVKSLAQHMGIARD